ncbi:hypothetical protein [Actinophytocola sp.]|uniref:hypothetical protein n=1 Tax=Actinophytocola sp. TaxID=1872138 RepID=UPI002D7F4FCC|nr:hypothetical protein [Actinophytocola sp.]HET9138815.1 hypothetical protein [Actinophytocola sp.]
MELLGDVGRGLNEAFAKLDQYNAGLTAGRFTVTKDNVLAAAKIISGQADALDNVFLQLKRDLQIAPPGEDAVSTRIAPAWNDLLVLNEDSYASRVMAYVEGLRNLANQCAESARAYGYTDDEIAAVFGTDRA